MTDAPSTLTFEQIELVDKQLNREYLLVLIKKDQIIKWLALAVVALGGPIVGGALWARNQAVEFSNKILTPDRVASFELNAERAKNFVNSTFPLGSIIAWHKDMKGVTPLLEKGAWEECNGQTIKGPNGEEWRLPNLNGDPRHDPWPAPNPSRLFLRGSMTSGKFEADEFKEHSHASTSGRNFLVVGGPGTQAIKEGTGKTDHPQESSTAPAGGEETRPKNMSVVWIIRVK